MPQVIEERSDLGDHRSADALMETIVERHEQQIQISLRERHDGERGVADVEHRVLSIDR